MLYKNIYNPLFFGGDDFSIRFWMLSHMNSSVLRFFLGPQEPEPRRFDASPPEPAGAGRHQQRGAAAGTAAPHGFPGSEVHHATGREIEEAWGKHEKTRNSPTGWW